MDTLDGVVCRAARAGSAWFVTLLLVVAVLAPGGAARAEVVKNLYQGQVPVADRSEKELARTAREALTQVLVKVSGSTEVLTLPAVAESLRDALSVAQQFSYARTGNPEQPLAARFEFDPGWVSGLLTRAGAPLWTANRPTVLVWLAQDTPQGRQFVSRDTAPALVERLEASFERRGVPLRFPLFDLADSAAITPAQAWRLNETVLRHASSRYKADEILAGRLTQLSSGDWLGDWAYLSSHGRIDRSTTPESIDDFLDSGAALVADDMAARYAVKAGAAPASGVPMVVGNVRSYADYAAIVSWLEGLEVIDQASPEQIDGDRLRLRLSATVDAAQLSAIIEINRHLVPERTDPTDSELSYQWRH